MQNTLIYLVEDDHSIAQLIIYNLQEEGYVVKHFISAQELFLALSKEIRDIALFVLDVMLPGPSGYEICQDLRKDPRYAFSSFLFLTARTSEQDKVQGFLVGADDYLCKPFGIREFLVRVKALILRQKERRILQMNKGNLVDSEKNPLELVDQNSDTTLILGSILIDDARHRVYRNHIEVSLTHKEYELLKFLVRNKELAFSRDQLLHHVWGYDYAGGTRTVDVHIRQLRRKFEEDPANPQIFETVRGLGYRLNANHIVGDEMEHF